jgi:ribosomal protein L7/L12
MNWYWGVILAVIVFVALLSRRGERGGSKIRIRSGDAPPSPERIDQFLREGQKIEAIKEYRVLHGVDLKTAKDAIDARARELGR